MRCIGSRTCTMNRSLYTCVCPLIVAGTKVEDARALLESAVHFSESTFKAVWDGSIQEQPAKLQGEGAGTHWWGAAPMFQRQCPGQKYAQGRCTLRADARPA